MDGVAGSSPDLFDRAKVPRVFLGEAPIARKAVRLRTDETDISLSLCLSLSLSLSLDPALRKKEFASIPKNSARRFEESTGKGRYGVCKIPLCPKAVQSCCRCKLFYLGCCYLGRSYTTVVRSPRDRQTRVDASVRIFNWRMFTLSSSRLRRSIFATSSASVTLVHVHGALCMPRGDRRRDVARRLVKIAVSRQPSALCIQRATLVVLVCRNE